MASSDLVEDGRRVNGVHYKTLFEKTGDQRMVVKAEQDVQPILDNNKEEFNHFDGYHGKEMVRVASIPNIIVDQLMKEGIWQNKERMRKWLNDPDNKAFRTAPGKV